MSNLFKTFKEKKITDKFNVPVLIHYRNNKGQVEKIETHSRTDFQQFTTYENSFFHSIDDFKDDIWNLLPMQLGVQSILKRTGTISLSPEEIGNEGVGTKDFPFVIKVTYSILENFDMKEPLVTITPKYQN